jgi:hypothetical protein
VRFVCCWIGRLLQCIDDLCPSQSGSAPVDHGAWATAPTLPAGQVFWARPSRASRRHSRRWSARGSRAGACSATSCFAGGEEVAAPASRTPRRRAAACWRRGLLLRARVDTSGQSSGPRILSPPRRHAHRSVASVVAAPSGAAAARRRCACALVRRHLTRPGGAAARCQGTAHADRQARTSTEQFGVGMGRNAMHFIPAVAKQAVQSPKGN